MKVGWILIALLLGCAVAAAQETQSAPPQGGSCFGAAGPRGAPAGGFQGRGGNGTGGGNRTGRGNGSFGGRPEPLPALNLSLDPAGPLTLEPGASAIVTWTLRNDGDAPHELNLSVGGFQASARPQAITARLDAATLRLAAGASAILTVPIEVSQDAPPGCPQNVSFRASESGTNRTALIPLLVDVPAAAPTSDATQAALANTPTTATAATKTVPQTGALAVLVLAAAVACSVPRRR